MNYGNGREAQTPAADTQVLQDAMVQIVDFAVRLEQRNEKATQQLQDSVHTLDQSTRQWSSRAEQFSQEALRVVGQQAEQVLLKSNSNAVATLRNQLHSCGETAQFAAKALAEQRHLLSRVQQTLVWKSLIALMLGSLLLAGGSLLIAWYSLRDVKGGEFQRDVLQAMKTGVLTPCGEGALCVKLDENARKGGAKGEYRVLVE